MSGIEAAPAPWELKGRVWNFALSGIPKTSSFPAGFAFPHEAEVMAATGEFIGGPGVVMIVSYSESPVGPYDELIYIPGKWKYPNGKTGFRITRIYVSSKESTENGRRNWNIPKQVANFSITTENGATTITVTHPDASSPFFHAIVKPVPLLGSIPIPYNTKILGQYFKLIQPPLPAGDKPEIVATSEWAALVPIMKGYLKLYSISPQLDGKLGDGHGFPAVVPWSIGGHLPSVEMDFGVPTMYQSLESKL